MLRSQMRLLRLFYLRAGLGLRRDTCARRVVFAQIKKPLVVTSQQPQAAIGQQRLFGTSRRNPNFKTVYTVVRGHKSIRQTFSLSGGKGGQNVNKVNTKVQLFFNVDEAEYLPDAVKIRLKNGAKNILNKDGEIVISSTATRSQHTNLVDAYQKLQSLVDSATPEPKKAVIKDQPSKHTKQKRVEQKRRRSDVKALRGRGKSIYE